jgi:hypothetical protein
MFYVVCLSKGIDQPPIGEQGWDNSICARFLILTHVTTYNKNAKIAL